MDVLNMEDNWTSVIVDIVRDDLDNTNTYYHFDKEQLTQFFSGLGQFFYVINPYTTSFEDHKDVPHFFVQAWPYFLLFIFLENLVLRLEGKPTHRINDTITSISNGLIQECGRLVLRGGESLVYIYVYDRWRVVDLRWDSAVTWYAAALAVDAFYYWVHRACHEVHILWAQHQVHHSSEEFNVAVGLRQSALQGWCGFIFYLPMALFIPPAQFLTHQQFSLLYQFWIHTNSISTLGPLEYIFNTPRHHRVHHGVNKYCLDKNYGGVLIIWDRIFGTFAAEKEKEEIVYGLVFNQPSFNPIHLQTFYTVYVATKVNLYDNWIHKAAAVFAGPSWSPGSPRLGDEKEKMDIRYREKYDVTLPGWCNLYLLVHFCVVVWIFQELAVRHMGMSQLSVLMFVTYIIGSLTTIGMMFDRRPNAVFFELVRCLVFAFVIQKRLLDGWNNIHLVLLQFFFVVSCVWWCLHGFKIVELKKKQD